LSGSPLRFTFGSLGLFARTRPRYLFHGVIAAAVSTAAVASVALQPRQVTTEPLSMAVLVEPTAQVSPLGPAGAFDTTVVSSTGDAAVTTTPEATAEPAATEEKPSAAKPIVHTVEEGESVRMLAAKFGISPETIMAANNLRNPDMLQVGQDLVILPSDGVLYTLRNGETLRRVAERFSVDTMDIVNANDLGGDPDVVQPGTLLMVPGATPQAAARTQVAVVHTDSGEQQIAAIGPGVSLPVDVTAQAAPSTRTYEVQAGDTLANIAETFGVDVNTILSSNGIDDPNTIKPGSELRILPVTGLEYAVQPSETLADIAWKYQVDLGLLLDYNDLNDPDVLRVGAKLVLPGGKLRADAATAPAPVVEAAPAPKPAAAVAAPAIVQPAAAPKPAAAAKPAAAPAAAPKPAAPAAPAPELAVGGGGGTIVANAMKYVGYRYVFGGTSPSGFDCSGFVYYIHNHSGAPVGRGMWQQFNGGAHISINALQPGDTVFFANTYMAGLSHDGIYIGGGQFVHASDERTGVTVSSIYTAYWQGHYAGATRLWN
jgi:cell wall-associated NlpC family hydrolase